MIFKAKAKFVSSVKIKRIYSIIFCDGWDVWASGPQPIDDDFGGFRTGVNEVCFILCEWRRCLGSWSEHPGEFAVGHLGQCWSSRLKDSPSDIQPDDVSVVVISPQHLTKLRKTKVIRDRKHVPGINLLAQDDIFVPQPVEDNFEGCRAGVEEIITYVN